MRSARVSQRMWVAGAMALAGVVMVVAFLPSWLLFTCLGAGLIAGAYFVFRNGL